MRDWLIASQKMDAGEPTIRPAKPIVFNGQTIPQPARWRFSAGNARISVEATYFAGDPTITLKTERQTPLAVLLSLHKGEGSGRAWLLLADSFALALIVLGISGLWMWARGRSARQMAFSTVSVAAVTVFVVAASAIA